MHADQPADASALEAASKPTRARRKPSAKPVSDQGDKRSLNLRIDSETYERLHVHALRRRVTVSELVMELARSGCRDFYISRTPGGRAGEDA